MEAKGSRDPDFSLVSTKNLSNTFLLRLGPRNKMGMA